MLIERRDYCPSCGEERVVDEFNGEREMEIRGEKYMVKDHYFICRTCGEEFSNLADPIDPLEDLYNKYRARHGWVQPEAIVAFRKAYGLTQRELAALLGWGDATLSRYENGALQDEAHERALEMIMRPEILYDMVSKPLFEIEQSRREAIMRKIKPAPFDSFDRRVADMGARAEMGWQETCITKYPQEAISLAA